jgi:hypothetical protein
MRKLLYILFLMPIGVFAQGYTASVDVPGKNSAALFSKAKEWFAESFKTPGVVPPSEDAGQGKLTGRENVTSIIFSDDVAVTIGTSFVLKIIVKDGQYKYDFDNIMIEHGPKFPLSTFKNGSTREGTIEMYKTAGMKSPSKKIIESNIDYSVKVVNKVEEEINRLIDSLAEKMKN